MTVKIVKYANLTLNTMFCCDVRLSVCLSVCVSPPLATGTKKARDFWSRTVSLKFQTIDPLFWQDFWIFLFIKFFILVFGFWFWGRGYLWLWLLALVTDDRLYVTGEMWHATNDTWHVSHDTLLVTHNVWEKNVGFFWFWVYYRLHSLTNSLSPVCVIFFSQIYSWHFQ